MFVKLKERRGSANVSACICILLSLVLIFSGLQLYELTSVSASSQETADSASLSAEGEVAKFYFVANTADGAILAMNVTQLVTYAIGVVAACSGNVAVSSDMIANANKIGEARGKFSTKAKRALNTYQKALPALATASAARISVENNGSKSDYKGIAVLVPDEGDEIVSNESDLDASGQDVESNIGSLQDKGEEVAEAEKEINKLKEEAYRLDCGDNPGYCLYERASSLSTLDASENPFYASPDTWDFNVAFERSLNYFENRASIENPNAQTTAREKSRSYLRKDYYNYCALKMQEAKNLGKGDSELYIWPDIYHEKNGFRNSERYRERIYPVTQTGDTEIMHSNAGMSCASGYGWLGSCADYDDGDFEQCSVCEFSTNNTGNIGSATTNTTSGFEHYFHKIAKLAKEFREKSAEFNEGLDELKSLGESFFSKLTSFFKAAKEARIQVNPPGRDGAVSIAADTRDVVGQTSFANTFMTATKPLGTRVAFSGAVLEVDSHDSGASLICERIAGMADSSSNSPIAQAWKSAVYAFADGTQAVKGAFANAGNSAAVRALLSSAGGKWAIDSLSSFADGLGLEPADFGAYKPVIASTASVVKDSSSTFARKYSQLQEATLANTNSGTSALSTLTNSLREKVDGLLTDSTLSIGSADFPIIGKFNFEVDFDSSLVSTGKEMVNVAINNIEDIYARNGSQKTWQ